MCPRVSIGMPVRNGERFIREAIESLLTQSFSDFELIICDNDSRDSTEAICREYAARDRRVRYYRNARNLGPAANHNRCFEMSRGEYFRWHAHDDMCAPDYLQKCVEALDADPTAVLVQTATLVVDGHGRPLEEYDFKIRTDATDPVRRFSGLVLVNHRRHRAVEIFGLMRGSALRQTPLEGSYARGDSVLLARLALLGRFVELPQRLFLSRSHSTQSMQTLPTRITTGRNRLSRYLGTGPLPPPEWWDSTRKGKISFPEWNLMKEYWRSIAAAPLGLGHQVRCHLVMCLWVVRNVPKLVRDLIFAAELMVAPRLELDAPKSDTHEASDSCCSGVRTAAGVAPRGMTR